MSSAVIPRSRVLLVEDDWFLADDMSHALRDAGLDVLGPVGRVHDALALIEASADEIGAAILDGDLNGERTTPITDALTRLGVPFLYATGYSCPEILGVRDGAPWLVKPVDHYVLLRILSTMAPQAGGSDQDLSRPRRAA